ncbi:hypothetical protein P376_0187 [Streptomyces sp. HCCB10043]|nr:hypothetical protein P376_0187 [Streptomyces sp. HCCB10043]
MPLRRAEPLRPAGVGDVPGRHTSPCVADEERSAVRRRGEGTGAPRSDRDGAPPYRPVRAADVPQLDGLAVAHGGDQGPVPGEDERGGALVVDEGIGFRGRQLGRRTRAVGIGDVPQPYGAERFAGGEEPAVEPEHDGLGILHLAEPGVFASPLGRAHIPEGERMPGGEGAAVRAEGVVLAAAPEGRERGETPGFGDAVHLPDGPGPARDDDSARGRERLRGQPVPGQKDVCRRTPRTVDVPQPHGVVAEFLADRVPGGGGEGPPVRGEREGVDDERVPVECLTLPGPERVGDVPQMDAPLGVPGRQRPAVGGEGHRADALARAVQGGTRFRPSRTRHVPQTYGAVLAGRGEQMARGAEGHRGGRRVDGGEGRQLTGTRHPQDAHLVVRGTGGDQGAVPADRGTRAEGHRDTRGHPGHPGAGRVADVDRGHPRSGAHDQHGRRLVEGEVPHGAQRPHGAEPPRLPPVRQIPDPYFSGVASLGQQAAVRGDGDSQRAAAARWELGDQCARPDVEQGEPVA